MSGRFRQAIGRLVPVSRSSQRRALEQQQAQIAHLTAHIEAADRWIESAERWQRAAGAGAGSAAAQRPFDKRLDMPGLALESFDHELAGPVLGYRDGEGAGGGQAGFAKAFRGPESRIRELQQPYLRLASARTPVLDVGCGRGEFLDLLREQGIESSGLDADPEMVERCRAKGNSVTQADANEYLSQLQPGSLGTIFSAQVIEHLPHADLVRFLELARERLAPNGQLVAETLNPHEPEAMRNFWADPTHQRPVFPETLLALCRAAGYGSAFIFYPQGSGDPEVDLLAQPVYAVVATP
jgi:SAM-dependent methyltransferase